MPSRLGRPAHAARSRAVDTSSGGAAAARAPTKAALVQSTRILALEWSRHNIQVNALCPGYFLTPMNEEFFSTVAGRRLIESMPMKRIGAPEEIGGAVVSLASAAASYVTGANLYVDGG